MSDNELWREESEDIPVAVSYRTGEGIVVRIEDRKLDFSTWSAFCKRIDNVKNNVGMMSYDSMDDKNQAVIDYCEEVIEKHNEKMEVVENV